jgi:hypothetical protein
MVIVHLVVFILLNGVFGVCACVCVRVCVFPRSVPLRDQSLPPLWAAVESGRVEFAKFLINARADVDVRRDGTSIVDSAIRQGDLRCVRQLLSSGLFDISQATVLRSCDGVAMMGKKSR